MFRPAQIPIVFDAGSVWLVGNGSGAPEIVTSHGLLQPESIAHGRPAAGEIVSLAAPSMDVTDLPAAVAPAVERPAAWRQLRQQPRIAG